MTVTEPKIPSPLPPLPPVDEDFKSQIHTHSSAMSTQNPPYDRLALLGSAIVQAAITRILFNHPDFLDTRQICDLRSFYVSSANLGFWGCSYEFDKSIITSNIHLTPASLIIWPQPVFKHISA